MSAEFIDARLIHVRKTTRIAPACIADANPFALRVGKIGSRPMARRDVGTEKSDDYGRSSVEAAARQYHPDLGELARQRFDFD